MAGKAIRPRMLALTCLLASLLLATSASAIVPYKSLRDLTAESKDILIGTVTEMHSQWNYTRTLIETFVTIAVKQPIKGKATREITFVVPGGAVGDLECVVSDTPDFQLGEQVMVFLKKGKEGVKKVTGWYQGKFSIKSGMILGTQLSVRDMVKEITKLIKAE